MKETVKQAMRVFMLVIAMTMGVNVCNAAETEMTEEFINEGIEKAEIAMANIVKNINEITDMEQLSGLERAVNTIEFRNVRKKYGKIKLTDEHRARLLEANKAMAKAMMDLMIRVAAPFEVRDALQKEMTEERMQKELEKAKTLREAMS